MAEITELRVPVFDFDTGEFVIGLDGAVKTATGSEAVGIIAVKAEQTERGVFPVYGDYENEEENHVYGSDVKAFGICGEYPKDVRLSEVKRATKEAIEYDPWIESVDSVEVIEGTDLAGNPCFIVSVEFTDIFRNSVLVEGVEVNGS